MPANTRRRTIATNRRSSMMPLSESSNTIGTSSSNDGIPMMKTRSGKQRMSMIPRTTTTSSTSNSSNSMSRHSVTPGKVSGRPMSSGRKSIASIHYSPHPSSSSSLATRQSLSVPSSIPPPTTTRTDNRPISDKAYFNSCIKKLHSYLEQNHYNHPIKLKDLSRPSGKDFQNIMTFLLTKCDPSFSSSSSSSYSDNNNKHKFEDDVANMFKTLGYPFNISKTALVAAGSPHTWPSLLLAITWLIELLSTMSDEHILDVCDHHHNHHTASTNSDYNHDYIFHDIPQPGSETLCDNNTLLSELEIMDARNKVAMQRFLERSYESFLFGDDDLYEKMESDLIEYVEKDCMVIEQAIERTTDENALIVEKVVSVSNEVEDLPAQQQRLEKLANNLEEFHALVNTLNAHKNELTSKVEERQADLKIKSTIIATMEKKIKDLIETISTQEYSLEDVHHLERQKAQLEETLEQTLLKREKFETVILKSEVELKREMERLERFIVPYNELILELPIEDDNKKTVVTQIQLQKELVDEKDQKILLGRVDLKNNIVPAVMKLEEMYHIDTTKLRSYIYEMLKKEETLEQDITDCKEKTKILTESNRRTKEIFLGDKKEHEEELSAIKKEINLRQEKVVTLRDPSAIDLVMTKFQSQIDDLNILIKKHQEENLARKQAVMTEVNEVLRIVSEYKVFREKEIKSLQKYLKSRQQFDIILSEEDMKVLSS